MDWNYFADLIETAYADTPEAARVAARVRERGLDAPGTGLWNAAGPAVMWVSVRLRGPLPRVDGTEVALIRYPDWAVVMISDDRPDELLSLPELRERALYDAAWPFFDSLPGREAAGGAGDEE